jgi:hypothetical protein
MHPLMNPCPDKMRPGGKPQQSSSSYEHVEKSSNTFTKMGPTTFTSFPVNTNTRSVPVVPRDFHDVPVLSVKPLPFRDDGFYI